MKFACNNRIPGRNDYWIDFVKFISLSLFPPPSPFFLSFLLYTRLFNPSTRTGEFIFSLPSSTWPCKKEGRKKGRKLDGVLHFSDVFVAFKLHGVLKERRCISAGIREIAFPFVARRKEQRYWKMLMCANKLKLRICKQPG